MLEFSAYVAAQRVIRDQAYNERSSSRMQARVATGGVGVRLVAARQWASTVLRQLADVVAVAPDVPVRSQPIAHHA